MMMMMTSMITMTTIIMMTKRGMTNQTFISNKDGIEYTV